MSLLAEAQPVRRRIRRGLGLLGDSFSANCHTIDTKAFGTEAYGYAGRSRRKPAFSRAVWTIRGRSATTPASSWRACRPA